MAKKDLVKYLIENNFANLDNYKKSKVEYFLNKFSDQLLEVLKEEEIKKIDKSEFIRIFNILLIKNFINSKKGILKLLKLYGIDVNINLGRWCLHKCKHCSISCSPNFKPTDIDLFINKFASNVPNRIIKNIKSVSFFMSGEILEYKDIFRFFEYFLSQGVSKFKFVTRGPVEQSIEDIKVNFEKLKKKYPNFDVDVSLSLDPFSSYIDINIRNVAELSKLFIDIFGHNKISISSLLIEQQGAEEFYKLFLRLLSIFIKYMDSIGFEFVDILKDPNGLVIFLIFKYKEKKIKFFIKYDVVLGYGRGKKFSDVRISSIDVNRPILCEKIFKPFFVDIDNFGNLRFCCNKYCEGVDKAIFGNLSNVEEAIEKYLSIKRDYYNNLTIEDIVLGGRDHYCFAIGVLNKLKQKEW